MIYLSIIGSRGIPANYGGFETFVEKLSSGLPKEDYIITVVCDAEHKKYSNIGIPNNIRLVYSKYAKQANPIKYYLD